ncbi:hypothetical protein ACIQZG_14675 [Lysinibacillus sp. NPDC096418]|uniref:hypothetical protein n=1 Tax=Lysinibacillus sp. NPDC096418 TaxID=3364138 RepID=UPI00382E6AF1
MMVYEEKNQQVKFMKWLTIALVLKLVYLDVFPGAYYVQHLLMYFAFMKSLSYFDGVTHAKGYITIGFGLLLVNMLSEDFFMQYWLLIFSASIDLLIIFEFFKILKIIEEKLKVVNHTTRIMKKYMWLAIGVIVSWTFLMNLEYFSQMVLLFIGALILFGINVRLLIHLRHLKKHVKSTMHFVTYT